MLKPTKFRSELERYQFANWLYTVATEQRGRTDTEANNRVLEYNSELNRENPSDDALKLLQVFRNQQNDADKNHPNHNDDQRALSFEPTEIS